MYIYVDTSVQCIIILYIILHSTDSESVKIITIASSVPSPSNHWHTTIIILCVTGGTFCIVVIVVGRLAFCVFRTQTKNIHGMLFFLLTLH